MDADGLTFACATTAEERAARGPGCAPRCVGLGARERRPRGRARLVRARRRACTTGSRAGRCSTRRASSTTTGAVLWEGEPLGVSPARGRRRSSRASAVVDDPAERAPAARAHRRGRGRHGERRARAHRPARRRACARSATRPTRPLERHRRRGRRPTARSTGAGSCAAFAPRAARCRARGARTRGARCERLDGGGQAVSGSASCSPRRARSAPASTARSRSSSGCSSSTARRSTSATRSSTTTTSSAGSRGSAPSSSTHEDEVPAGAICVLSAHGVAPAVQRELRASAACASSTPSARSSRRCTPRRGATPTAAISSRSSATPTTSR